MDIHHIFPKAWCERQTIPDAVYNSIINKTPLTSHTNRVIGGYAPSIYLPRLASSAKVSEADVEPSLRTHLVDPDRLRSDDFAGFMNDRRDALLQLISDAMGKGVELTLTPDDVVEPASSEDDLEDA